MKEESIHQKSETQNKCSYNSPQLTVLGKIETITRGTGNKRDTDAHQSCEGGAAGICGS